MKTLVLLTLLCAGCSPVAIGPEIGHQDGAEIRIYNSRVEMLKALPPTVRALDGFAEIRGWYERERKIIHSVNDPRIVEHELRHHTDPMWSHPVSCVYLPC